MPREIILGVGGGISAYKSCELLRRLQDAGYGVTVIPTRSSLNFVGTSTWEALSGREVPVELWNRVHEVPHISLAKNAKAIVIAPTTADLLARLAQGRADDLLTNTVLASQSPLILVPAMHPEMWSNSAVVANVKTLRDRGVHIVEPGYGRMTGEDIGVGRYPEVALIIDEINSAISAKNDLVDLKVVVSAGGTQEAIDPVRFIGNHSSGRQGIEIARNALERGASVELVVGSVSETALESLGQYQKLAIIQALSAHEMLKALSTRFGAADILFMSAAVADARPAKLSQEKLEKADFSHLELETNPDILVELKKTKRAKQVVVAFAAGGSTDDPQELAKAQAKVGKKGADLLYFNDVVSGGIFGSDTSEGLLLDNSGVRARISNRSKADVASLLVDEALVVFNRK